MLKFSPANAKTKKLYKVEELQQFLKTYRKVFSLDLLSGHSCPFADKCLSKVIVDDKGRKHIQDGPNTEFRCFSASQEVLLPPVYNLRKHNFDLLRKLTKEYGDEQLSKYIDSQLPNGIGILRMDVGGDLFNQVFFDSMLQLADRNPWLLVYGYTKSLPYWVKRLDDMVDNFVLTASRGGKRDDLIDEYGLREARVCLYETFEQAKKSGNEYRDEDIVEYWDLPVDHDDSHAACPSLRNDDFTLLIHGPQPAGSNQAQALQYWKGTGKNTYSRKKGTK